MKEYLLQYWPVDEEITACIRTDAEAAFEAVSQAVHQPMIFNKRDVGEGFDGSFKECTERELLEEFLRENLPDARVILPIIGESGTGKSHVIRWLDAQIRNLPGADKRVVFRVPKGSSLKGVLNLLVENLDGKQYDKFRKEILRAQEDLESVDASGLLCELIAQELSELYQEAKNTLIANPRDEESKLIEAYCNPKFLPALLRNQYLRDHHFVTSQDGSEGVVLRLIVSLTQKSDLMQIEDERQLFFRSEDLVFDHIPREELGISETRAIHMLNERTDRRAAAVTCLNRGLDGAKQSLLRLDPTVSDLFDEIRKVLLEEGKELILLIEDFAVLTGLQKQLLQVIIKEGVRDGKQILCTMRTALAYTSDYYVPETVLTRAGKIYEVSDILGNEKLIHEKVERLVGAYLNAARCGNKAIETNYRTWRKEGGKNVEWVPNYVGNIIESEQNTLGTFGESLDGYPLFPFNRNSIRILAEDGCRKLDQFVYNPRNVIQNVLQKVLNHRMHYQSDKFPPENFEGTKRLVSSEVNLKVGSKIGDAVLRNRYLRLLAYWGGCPDTTEELSVFPTEIGTAFGLPNIDWGGKVQESIEEIEVDEPIVKPEPVPKILLEKNQQEVHFKKALEQWRKGTRLPQKDANQLRLWIFKGVEKSIDWDWYLFRPHSENTKKYHQDIYLPNSAGSMGRDHNHPSVIFALGTEGDLKDEVKSSKIIAFLMAVVRHNIYKSWDYESSDGDLVEYSANIKNLSGKAKEIIKSQYFEFSWDPLPTLVRSLIFGAMAIGIKGSGIGRMDVALNSLFELPDLSTEQNYMKNNNMEQSEWLKLQSIIGRTREEWIGHLKDIVGARQGGAEKVHSVDVSQMVPIINALASDLDLGEACPGGANASFYTNFKENHTEARRLVKTLNAEKVRLVKWYLMATQHFGENPDKQKISATIIETLERCRSVGIKYNVDTVNILELLEHFESIPLKETIKLAGELKNKNSNVEILEILGKNISVVASDTEVFMRQYGKVEKYFSHELAARLITSGSPLDGKRDALLEEIKLVEGAVGELLK